MSQNIELLLEEESQQSIRILAKGSSVALFGKIGGRVTYSLREILLARTLGPASYGIFSMAWSILRLIESVTPLGLHNGVIHFSTKYFNKDKSRFKGVLIQSMAISFGMSILLGTLLFFTAPNLEIFFKKATLSLALKGFAIALPFSTLLKVAAAETRITQNMKYTVISEDFGQPVLNILFLIPFILIGLKLQGAILAAILGFSGAASLALLFVFRLFKDAIKDIKPIFPTKELMAFSIPTTFTGILPLLTNWSDRLFIGYFLSAKDLGVYQALSQTPIFFSLILRGINLAITPMVASLYHKNKFGDIEKLFRIGTKWGLYISLPVFFTIWFAPREIMEVLFGSEYAQDIIPLIIISFGQLINMSTGAVGTILIMTGNQNHWLKLTIIALLCGAILHITLIPRLGLTGAAISTSVSIGGLYILGILQARKLLGIWPFDERYNKLFISSFITLLVMLSLNKIKFELPLLKLLTYASISVITVGISLFLQRLDSEDKEFFNLMYKRVNRK